MSRESESGQRFDALVEWLYDAAVDARDWRGFAAGLAEAFDSTGAALGIHDGDHSELLDTTDPLAVAPVSDPAWLERALAAQASFVATGQEPGRDSAFKHHARRGDSNHPLGDAHVMGTAFRVGADAHCVLSIHRPRHRPDFAALEHQRMEHLLPHLRRALRLRSHAVPERLLRHTRLEAVSRLGAATMVLDGQARLLQADRHAEVCLRSDCGLSLRSGQVVADCPSLAPRWRRLIQQAGSCGGGGG